ncbi:MAG: 3-phosphoshikimate 1-carboxyvinyltransferase [Anaerolineae bacterium]|jgi:3-phosphoshikimate 1-carboxyvinyltransferase|nr:3-phosphoshikimate 1-carboxyvinyltransferase [Anaerolineae bacterium]OQY83808.1 MAG: 3-phosphoshikimate 1-carboxyvinyltransferase [Anaerolineae bacterium UTCFX5]GIK29423.1 MAG: 3-phosphoshikimate 1-carboxyvinyltransferase [Chloroflexota bacterium]
MARADKQWAVRPSPALAGMTTVPGDKSLSHRAVLFGALAGGTSTVRGWLAAGDTEASLATIQALGVRVKRHDLNTLTIHGGALQPPGAPLNLVNAGTGIRLLAGIMVGQSFASVLDGSEQLRRRPMKRIIEPLGRMGAKIASNDGRAPLSIEPAPLHGIHYDMPMASAQVKSAVLLAGLFAEGETVLTQPGPARDHTERMLTAMGANLSVDGMTSTIRRGASLRPFDMTVPGDASSAAFPIVAAAVIPGSDITLTGVNLNDTRTGIIDVLREMGADFVVTETGLEAGEPVGTVRVRYAPLRAIDVGGEVVVRMIDEFPVFMIAALCAEGTTTVRDAQELRVKETDRIAVMAAELRKFGAQITETDDGFSITGPQQLHGATVDSHDDHRIAMSCAVAGLIASGETSVLDAGCAADSFPGFAAIMSALGAPIVESAGGTHAH